MEKQHVHAEAFMHMNYAGKSARASINMLIWNSRNGVTPMFCTLSAFPGVQLSHVSWQADKYDPNYKPKKGDYIWRDWSDDEVKEFGAKQFDEFINETIPELEKMTAEEIQAKYSYDLLAHVREITAKGKDAWLEMIMKQHAGRGEPFLEKVEKDWE